MKKRIPTFLAGMATMATITALTVTALAVSGTVTFNSSNLSLNGTQISAKGEGYTLANGQSVPASITYTDENGGGTTYLPVRRIAELLGVKTGWDGTTGSVTVGETTPAKTPDTTSTADYSTWTAEEEKAYQEFKGMWKVEPRFSGFDNTAKKECDSYNVFLGNLSKSDAESMCSTAKTNGYMQRLGDELRKDGRWTTLWFYNGDIASNENYVFWFNCN